MLYVDGNWVKTGEAVIQPEDRGYNFGDGIYEVIRVYAGVLYQWDEHIARLYRSAEGINLTLPWSKAELRAISEELLRRNALQTSDGIVYLQISRGVAPRQHDVPANPLKPVITAFARQKARPVQELQHGITAALVPDLRWLMCDIKSLNLLGAVLAKETAKKAGANDCILHRDGIVTECSAANLFAVKQGELYTHPATNLILHGITRQTIISLAAKNGIGVHEVAFDTAFVQSADELFLTGTVSEIMPIVKLDGVPVGNGEIGSLVKRLQALFEAEIFASATAT